MDDAENSESEVEVGSQGEYFDASAVEEDDLEDDFDETAFIDDSIVVTDEPMASDNISTDTNPTEIQDDEVGS